MLILKNTMFKYDDKVWIIVIERYVSCLVNFQAN